MSTIPANTSTTAGVGEVPGASSAGASTARSTAATWSRCRSWAASAGAFAASRDSPPTIRAVAAARTTRSRTRRDTMRMVISLTPSSVAAFRRLQAVSDLAARPAVHAPTARLSAC